MEKVLLKKIIACLEKTLQETLEKNLRPVAAFDADGTLWPRDVGKSFFQYQVANRILSKDPQEKFNSIRAEKGREMALIWLAQAQAGFSLKELNQWIREFLQQNPFRMFSFQQCLIEWLMSHKVEVFVVSSSLKWVLDQALLPYHIPQQNIVGVQTEVQKGIITDKPILPAPIQADKVPAFQAVAKGARPFLVAGNTLADQALLEFSSHWHLVVRTAKPEDRNYDSERKLLKIAMDRSWFYYDSQV